MTPRALRLSPVDRSAHLWRARVLFHVVDEAELVVHEDRLDLRARKGVAQLADLAGAHAAFEPPAPSRLFGAKDDRWVHPRRSPGRQVAGAERNQGKRRGGRGQRNRIGGSHAVEHPLHEARGGEGAKET